MSAPQGTTHVKDFYGSRGYYREQRYQHLNQVSEEWETRSNWYYWDEKMRRWVDVGRGFSPRLLKEVGL